VSAPQKRKHAEGIVERHERRCAAYAEVEGRRVPSGRPCNCDPSYRAWIYDKRAGRKRLKTFSGRGAQSAAKGWRRDELIALKAGALNDDSRATLRKVAADWLEDAKQGKVLSRSGSRYKGSTVRGYEADLDEYVLPALWDGNVKIGELRRRDVQSLVDGLVGKGLSGSKVRNALMPLRAICRYLIERDQLTVNPTANVKLPKPSRSGSRERAETAANAGALLDALPDDDRALWATAFYAGLRRGELRALAVAHVDLKAKTDDGEADPVINVERSWDEVDGFVDTKSEAGDRFVPVPPVLKTLLAEHVARTGRRGGDLLFGRTPSEPFVATTVRKRALAAWKAENEKRAERKLPPLAPIGLHECRHVYVTWLEQAGVSDTVARAFAGHAREKSVTGRYRHVPPDARVEAMERLHAHLTKNVRTERAVG
jgi:integrase